ncbi:MAG: DNA polymerase IV [Candidatus Binatia bacterium]
MTGPVVLHADMDAFYAAVEQRDNPQLRGRPVVVGGLGGRGVVTAASYEARRFGVRSAMPMFEARRLCPDAVYLPGRMSRYSEVSRQVFEVFREFTPEVEPLSLDEAFLDVTRSLGLFGTPLEIGRSLRARVRERLDLAVSVGIAPSKMAAKIASTLCKPDGLLEVKPDEVAAFLAPLPASHLWGVGPVTGRALEQAGFRTIGDLAAADPHALAAAVGSQASALRALALGQDVRSVEPDRARKSYGEENTFGRDMRDGDELRRTIVAHAEAVAARLRADSRLARTVVLKLKLAGRIGPGRYPLLSRRRTLGGPTDDGTTIARAALSLWDELATGKVIRLIGVSVASIQEVSSEQLSLLAWRDGERRAALNRALDAIAAKFGREALRRGGVRVERAAPTLTIKAKRER